MTQTNRADHIRLTSHPGAKPRFPVAWGAATARERGPIVGTVSRPQDRNVIGTHGGSYALYRALAVSSRALDPLRRPDLAKAGALNREKWVRLLSLAGFTEDDMQRWHQAFERHSPKGHQQFLEYLCIPKEEVERIRLGLDSTVECARSETGRRGNTPLGGSDREISNGSGLRHVQNGQARARRACE